MSLFSLDIGNHHAMALTMAVAMAMGMAMAVPMVVAMAIAVVMAKAIAMGMTMAIATAMAIRGPYMADVSPTYGLYKPMFISAKIP